MLKQVFQTIEKKVEREKEKILKEKEKEIADLKKWYLSELEKLKRKKREEFRGQLQKDVALFKEKKEREMLFALQQKKKKIVEEIYKKLKEEIVEKENLLQKLIFKSFQLVKNLPQGEIKCGEKTEKILRRFPEIKKFTFSGRLNEEGFVVETPQFNVDCRVSQIISQKREEWDPLLYKILFKQ